MGMLEDLLLGGYFPSNEDLARREEEYEAWLRSQAKGTAKDLYSDIKGGVSDPYEMSTQRAGLKPPLSERAASSPSMRDAAQESIDSREAREKIAAFNKLKEETETKIMQDKAYRQQLDPESWIGPSLGEDQTPEGKLMAIRAEAKARGRAGSLGGDPGVTAEDYMNQGGGGSFSQQDNSPELQRRLAERDEFIAGQPMRNLEFAMTPDQARRDPNYAAKAGDVLTGLKGQQAIDRRQQIQEMFVQKLAGSGGTIPREQVAQLQALGVTVPYSAIGSGKDEGIAFFDDAIMKAGTFLSGLDPVDASSGHPMIKVQNFGIQRAEYYRQLVESGQMNSDDARAQWTREVAMAASQAGVINAQEAASMQAGG